MKQWNAHHIDASWNMAPFDSIEMNLSCQSISVVGPYTTSLDS